jgi:hypothetical protein
VFIIGAVLGLIVAWLGLKRKAGESYANDAKMAWLHAEAAQKRIEKENRTLKQRIDSDRARFDELLVHLGNAVRALR